MNKVRQLAHYLPEPAAPVIARWIDLYQVQLRITRSRRTKLGDYRPPQQGYPHRISINHDLNPYAFLVTLVHEFAHLVTWNHHGSKALSHGKEWKGYFRKMMQPFFELDVFPADIRIALERYLRNPAAASCTDLNLLRTLRKYDPGRPDKVAVEQLPEGAVFALPAGRGRASSSQPAVSGARVFRKGPRLRKRFRCTELASGRVYLFNPLAEVVHLPAGTVS